MQKSTFPRKKPAYPAIGDKKGPFSRLMSGFQPGCTEFQARLP
jgi:hypothetical protein